MDKLIHYQQWSLYTQVSVAAATAIMLLLIVIRLSFSPIKNIPGPPRSWFIGNLIQIAASKEKMNDFFLDCTQKYGSVFTFCIPFQPSMVCSIQPADVKHILKDNFDNYIKGSEFADRFREVLGNGIFNVDGQIWKTQRQIAAQLFTRNTMSEFMTQVFLEHSNILVQRLSFIAKQGTIIDMQDLFFRFTMDSIGKIAFGRNLGCLTTESVPFSDAFDTAQYYAEKRFYSPIWKLEKWFTSAERQLRASVQILNEFAFKLIKERRQESNAELKRRPDLLSMFMSAEDSDGNALNPSDEFLRDVVMNYIIAGRDTTACTLTWFLYEMTRNPEVLARIQQELDQVLEGRDPTYEDVDRNLKYLDAVIMETLRLHTPVPKDPKQAVRADVLPSGHVIPAGTIVIYAPWVMGRSEHLWKNAMEFNPDRFLNQPVPDPYHYPVFQAGPRICLGRNMALLEAKMCAAVLLSKFNFKRIKDHEPFTYKVSATLPAKDGLFVNVIPRK